MNLRDAIRTIPDHPKPGIMFRDITTLLGDARAFRQAIEEMVTPFAGQKIEKVAGIEARGFIFGAAIAHQLSAGFVPLRKKGKLPHKTVAVEYALEYGTDAMEMHVDAIVHGERVMLVDDLIATGGTAEAALKLLRGKATLRAAADRAVLLQGQYTKRQDTWFAHHPLAAPERTRTIGVRMAGMTQQMERILPDLLSFVVAGVDAARRDA